MDTEDLSALEEPLLALTGGGFEEFVTVQLVGQSSTELGESCHSDACDRIRAFLCGAAVAHSRLPFQLCLLREKGHTGEILTVCYEPVTGSHVGPGALALFFMGEAWR